MCNVFLYQSRTGTHNVICKNDNGMNTGKSHVKYLYISGVHLGWTLLIQKVTVGVRKQHLQIPTRKWQFRKTVPFKS